MKFLRSNWEFKILTAGNSFSPDFLCIGMQKAGTRWIYDAMSQLSRVEMPPIKEFNHFAAMFGRKGEAYDVQKNFRRQVKNLDKAYSHITPAVRTEFLSAVDRYVESGSHEDYLALFCMSGGKVTGDVSPAYSMLSDSEVLEVKKVLPDVRIVLSVRHPVARAWSQFNMQLRMTMQREGVPGNSMQKEIVKRAEPKRFKRFLQTDRVKLLSHPSSVYDRWQNVFGEVFVIDFDEMTERPKSLISKVSREFLNAPLSEGWAPMVANVKGKTVKVRMQPEHAEIAYYHFRDEIMRCRERFDFAAEWQVEPPEALST